MTQLNLDKPVVCRNGQKARIVCKDAKGVYPVLALITPAQGNAETPTWYTALGQFPNGNGNSPLDLLQCKTKRWKWLVLDEDKALTLSDKHYTEAEAVEAYGEEKVFDKVARTEKEFDE
jgi:hypothetical protein